MMIGRRWRFRFYVKEGRILNLGGGSSVLGLYVSSCALWTGYNT